MFDISSSFVVQRVPEFQSIARKCIQTVLRSAYSCNSNLLLLLSLGCHKRTIELMFYLFILKLSGEIFTLHHFPCRLCSPSQYNIDSRVESRKILAIAETAITCVKCLSPTFLGESFDVNSKVLVCRLQSSRGLVHSTQINLDCHTQKCVLF